MTVRFLISISLISLTFSSNLFAQIDVEKQQVLVIYDENGFVNSDELGLFHYLISVKSKDSLFKRDGYKFVINNQTGFEKYADLEEIGEEVSLATLEYIEISDLANLTNCELHNYLSRQKKIYVIFNDNKNSFGGIDSYRKYPVIYEGTQKNLEMLKM